MKWILLLFSILLPYPGFCQSENVDIRPCSSVFAGVSYYWQLDSLPSNGYRALVKRYLLDCEVDSVSIDYILEKLGPPTGIGKGVEFDTYEYRYYDWKFIDQTKLVSSYGFDSILIIVDKKTKLLRQVSHQTGEY